MSSRSAAINNTLRTVLTPFLTNRKDWILHYPVYLNAFCFAYELSELIAELIAETGISTEPDPLGGNFQRHNWAQGLPEFRFQRDIEIFVAVQSMIDAARIRGHRVEDRQIVRFTRYDVKSVFVRNWETEQPKDWLLVTDLEQVSDELLSTWADANKRPNWLQQLKVGKLTKQDRRFSSERELHDLFSKKGKIYVFTAPMAFVLKGQAAKTGHVKAKYQEEKANLKPIDTFYVFRCNSNVDPLVIKSMATAISRYYQLIFGKPKDYLHPKVAREYGRLASTVGQPHPFPELHDPQRLRAVGNKKLIERYASILTNHHHS